MYSASQFKRQVLALDDKDLEAFVRDWVSNKKNIYKEIVSFGGGSDLGRDVVGFLSDDKHEGAWHNYQCKQYKVPLTADRAFSEIGKILSHAFSEEFTPPEKYIFVAPRGANRKLESYIYKPSQFKSELIKNWDKITENKIPLTSELHEFIYKYDFSKITLMNLEAILSDQDIKPALYKWFQVDPGPAPKGQAPEEIDEKETPYIQKLFYAYSERDGKSYKTVNCLKENAFRYKHLCRQRERFFDADAFKRFFRDNTDIETINSFEEDIYNGVVEECETDHADSLCRVDSVLKKAASIMPSGPLSIHARVTVRQGICHHLANEDKLEWKN